MDTSSTTHGGNPGRTSKTPWYLSNEICMDTYYQDCHGEDNSKTFYWNLDGEKYQIRNVCLFIENKHYSCRFFFGSQTFVSISWICKKQTSVSHSSTEAENISLDASLRMDGIPAPHSLGMGDWSISFRAWQNRWAQERATGKPVGNCKTRHAKPHPNQAHHRHSNKHLSHSTKHIAFWSQCHVVWLWGQWGGNDGQASQDSFCWTKGHLMGTHGSGETCEENKRLQDPKIYGQICGSICLMQRRRKQNKDGLSRNQSSKMPDNCEEYSSLNQMTKSSSSQWKPLVESWKFRCQQQCLAKNQ